MAVHFAVFSTLCGFLISMTAVSLAEEGGKDEPPSLKDQLVLQDMKDVGKRYVAALAKNGRLPKYAFAKKDSAQNELSDEIPGDLYLEEKRHVGAFLKSHGKPSFTKLTGDGDFARYDRSTLLESNEAAGRPGEDDTWETAVKRNVASLARLGRLNAIRYGYFQPHYVSGKRLTSDEMSDAGASKNDEDNAIDVVSDADCEDDDDDESDDDASTAAAGVARPNWTQKKRYVAALARSGRLPVWHSQRMWWGGKRDTPTAYWLRSRTGARGGEGKRENAIVEAVPKSKRCKKLSRGDYPAGAQGKRNLAMLARNGKLPHRP